MHQVYLFLCPLNDLLWTLLILQAHFFMYPPVFCTWQPHIKGLVWLWSGRNRQRINKLKLLWNIMTYPGPLRITWLNIFITCVPQWDHNETRYTSEIAFSLCNLVCVWQGQGCKRLRRAGFCQCRAAVCSQLSSSPSNADQLPLF